MSPLVGLGVAAIVMGLLCVCFPTQMAWFVKAALTEEAKVRFTKWSGRAGLIVGVLALIAGFIWR